MTMERYIRLIAGTFILVSLALGYWVSPWFFLFTAFVVALEVKIADEAFPSLPGVSRGPAK